MTPALAESKESLWRLAVSPALWGAHFLACYATVAVWCAKFAGPSGELAPARRLILAATAFALAGIAANGWDGLRRSRRPPAPHTLAYDTDVDRHRFLGFATLLLAGLSAVATLYVAGAALYFEDCR